MAGQKPGLGCPSRYCGLPRVGSFGCGESNSATGNLGVVFSSQCDGFDRVGRKCIAGRSDKDYVYRGRYGIVQRGSEVRLDSADCSVGGGGRLRRIESSGVSCFLRYVPGL